MARATCALSVAQPDRAIAAHALAVGDDMRIGGRQGANPVADLVDFLMLRAVIVARDEVARIDTVHMEEDFAQAGTIERAVVDT